MLQRTLIRYLLEPLATWMERISVVKKEVVFRLCCLGIILICFVWNSTHYPPRYLYMYIISCVFLGIMVLVTLKPGLKVFPVRKGMVITWFATGVCILISGVLNTVDYLPEAILFLIGFPVVFLVWNHYGFEKILKMLVDSILLSYGIFMIVSILFFPMTGHRYRSFFIGFNGLSLYMVLVFAAAVSRVLQYARHNWKYCAAYSVVLGTAFATVFYTGSRSGQLTILGVLVFSLILYAFLYFKQSKIACIRCFFLITVAIALLFNTTLQLFQIENLLNKLPSWKDPPYSNTTPVTKPTVPTTEPTTPITKPTVPTTEPTTPITKPTVPTTEPTPPVTEVPTPPATEPVDNTLINVRDVLDGILSKIALRGRSLDEISSGRITLWTGLIKELNLFGHREFPEIHYIIPSSGADVILETAHNTILQIAYNHGIISALFYLIYMIMSVFAARRFALKNRESVFAIIPFVFAVTFAINSSFESLTTSVLSVQTMFYHLMQFCLWEKPAKKESLPS